ncbi:MAG: guanine deaminase [bacterium]
MTLTAHRGEILHFLGDPAADGEQAVEHFEDGVLLIEDGFVSGLAPADGIMPNLPAAVEIFNHAEGILIPGLIDTHIHFPQCEIIAAYGTQLLDWLETHTFPAEKKFSEPAYAESIANFFLDELIRNGTTSALVFGSVHPQSVDAFFCAAERRNLRMICGKVMMDRNAPQFLTDTPASSYDDSKVLINKWHNKKRLGYAVTPRFAPTSSPQQLEMAAKLIQEHPDVHLHTHLSENTDECKWVKQLYPESQNYLDVYDRFDLLGKRSVFAHGIHLSDNEWRRLHQTDSAVAHCPMSNLFIGSGLFNYQCALEHDVKVGLGTDVGGGDNFSILRTINEAYKVQQLNGYNLSPLQSLYLATLGGAKALDLDHYVGNFRIGKEADFVVLDCKATPLIEFRMKHCRDFIEKIFALEMLGDDRVIRETWIMGKRNK